MAVSKIGALAVDDLATRMRNKRDRLINAFMWRVERYNRQVRLGLTLTDDITALDTYIQALCEVPRQEGFPNNVTWPAEPAEPAD